MAQRFISKNTRRKYIRPLRGTMPVERTEVIRILKNSVEANEKPAEEAANEPVVVEETKKPKRGRKKITENKEENKSDMDANIEKIKGIVGDDAVIPERKVKIEKRDKGLLERTENSTILITEDNKMMLND